MGSMLVNESHRVADPADHRVVGPVLAELAQVRLDRVDLGGGDGLTDLDPGRLGGRLGRGERLTGESARAATATGHQADLLHLVDDGVGRRSGWEVGVAERGEVAAPREDACVYCDFQDVCGPYEEIRFAKKKDVPQLVQLKAMRGLA